MTTAARASLVIACAGGALMLAMVATRFARDGSMWLDEASIATNLLQQSPTELLGALATGHRFPRFYLLAIDALQSTLGYGTAVLRVLPFTAFVLGAILWQRLLFQRWREAPSLVLLATVLTLIPGTWFAYGAMLKQYSLDVLLALVPLLASDAFLDRTLREGRQRGRLLALAAPCLLSYTYMVPLAARGIAWWWAGRSAAGAPLRKPIAAGFAALVVALMLVLWMTDLRHARTESALGGFWAKCTLSGDLAADGAILARYLTGWARSLPVYGGRVPAPIGVVSALAAAFVLGCGAIAWRARRPFARAAISVETSQSDPHNDIDDARNAWGSRSLACLGVVAGTIAAGAVAGYPLCPGRLTLFSYFALLMVTLEGIALGLEALRGRGRWLLAGQAAIVALAVASMPAAAATVRVLLFVGPPENIRPLLPLIAQHPDRPVVVAACSTRQAQTMPEWRGRTDLYFGDDALSAREDGRPALPPTDEFWVVSAGSNFYCPWYIRDLQRRADSVRLVSPRGSTATLLHVRMPVAGRDDAPDQGAAGRDSSGASTGSPGSM